eukprot:CAMPEP_0196590820 /NCGR_PEP_ID=MMETSP1081-20130531/67674_1 /TAXON_ID=36882 /ORGANISM="Pyramimonas amylifera, Strain CCMP720" /LENGTH=107 /DNA_ID=CAMNT_0041914023 /DNA_START=45 /DNA_END=368 /DNA_ORIENTATION=-
MREFNKVQVEAAQLRGEANQHLTQGAQLHKSTTETIKSKEVLEAKLLQTEVMKAAAEENLVGAETKIKLLEDVLKGKDQALCKSLEKYNILQEEYRRFAASTSIPNA